MSSENNLEEGKVIPMNRAQRRAANKNAKKKMTIVGEELNENGQEFIKYSEEQNVNLNVFFKMFSYWLSLSTAQKEAVIVECVKQGKIDLEDGKSAEQNSESE